ncbi:MAG: alanine--tRNA ligase, partial [Rickettsiaceae bacterium]|nr:alanine--tRNA ligase [Rickettsiaceae bacterium]
MRRAMRHIHLLGAKDLVLHKMLPRLVDLMGSSYPELKRAENFVSEVLKSEEQKFRASLDKGIKLLDEESGKIGDGKILPGEVAFKLYDTYGFPLDLTQDILKNRKIAVDLEKFDALMEDQKTRARKAWSGSGESKFDDIWFNIKEQYGSTEFVGYSLDISEAVVAIIIKNKKEVSSAAANEDVIIITNQTPFYGESGGQMGDIGFISGQGLKIRVKDTKKFLGSVIAHIGTIESGRVEKGQIVTLAIDSNYRAKLRRHHSATHLLHKALKEVLGNHVAQKGSLVAHDKLRLDISHMKPVTKEELATIENQVNEMILIGGEVRTKLMYTEEAISSGAVALFGEKYEDEVRVVSMGLAGKNDTHYSVELCGGTHVANLGDIGLFKIMSESAISAGVRRIEAICGIESLVKFNEYVDHLHSISDLLKCSKTDVISRIEDLIESKKNLQNTIEKLNEREFFVNSEEINAKAISAGEFLLYNKIVKMADVKTQRKIAETISKQFPNLIFIFLSDLGEKVSIVVASGANAQNKISASNVAKFVSSILGANSGGGSDSLAQGAGNFLLSEEEIISKVRDHISHIT